jgi:hypothetical protein
MNEFEKGRLKRLKSSLNSCKKIEKALERMEIIGAKALILEYDESDFNYGILKITELLESYREKIEETKRDIRYLEAKK